MIVSRGRRTLSLALALSGEKLSVSDDVTQKAVVSWDPALKEPSVLS